MKGAKIVYSNNGHVVMVDFDSKSIVWNCDSANGKRLSAREFAEKQKADILIETNDDLDQICLKLVGFKKMAD